MFLPNSASSLNGAYSHLFRLPIVAYMFFVALFLPMTSDAAEPLPAIQGQLILLVSGNIEVTNGNGGAAFDREMLYGLGLTEITTTTPWTEGAGLFKGVLARQVLERVGAKGTVVLATALNDYTVEIPITDFLSHDVLLATELNGQEMKVSDKGPVWIVYPQDEDPGLKDRKLHERWVWQLKGLHIQ